MTKHFTPDYIKKFNLGYIQNRFIKNYTEEPTGDWDVDRLLEKNSKFWQSTTPNSDIIKKKIVISDWAFAYGVGKYEGKLILNSLLADGFTCYVIQKDKLVQVTSPTA